ncbi:DUF262 domain-containing protein [Paenibacillus alginolyticus]|uniref:DUF262 domain-containing protein n=1 Tax=Paenibacillus alginolyticus TaxID=59839 RepID=A0ABT4GJP6_9BACL|nr:DUF262 domain-containing protein [Paenibacillus alginolyticus]MCY9696419.1 DUF262 domain-containing protein [Paenibacillus alginolyticus]MEC0145266.1 DUF262 domain-containing protein [Paenibacillus alginolyticus]
MKLPEPQSRTFSSLISDIEKGQIKIPQFQRDFVWDIQKSAQLMDSIVKGYPIGTFIFWRTKERLRSVRNFGNLKLPDTVEGEYVDFVLDGQQRMTSLFASLKGAKIVRDNGKEDDYGEIYLDLTADEDDQIVILDKSTKEPESLIRLTDLLYGGLTLLAKFPPQYHNIIEEYKKRIEAYNYSIVQIREAPIDIATEIFTRINVGGKPLSVFEIMIAKTFDADKDFDLSEKYQDLIEDLKPLDYETISDATVLQTVSMLLEKECQKKVILKLDKSKFIAIWKSAVDAIHRTIEYFRGYYRIPVSQLLPYNALIVPFAYFFYLHPDKPIGDKQKYLQDFFWRCSISGRYSSGVESKLAQDIKRIDLILNDELPRYDWAVNTSDKFLIDNGWFSAGRSFIKAILCLYAYQQPKSFNDNSIVNISNYWLKQANSKNYHHFFPKAYLKKQQEEEFYINHILNITIVENFLNKREIRAYAPSKYMEKFKKVNQDLKGTMMTHLISDLDEFGVWDNDYDKFFEARALEVSKELQKRIIPQDIDKTHSVVLLDEVVEDEPEDNE